MDKVNILVNSHFDLMWRRPFKKNFVSKGYNYVSYGDLEAYYIIDNINFAKKHDFYKFDVECVDVLKNFLENYPEYFEDVKKLMREKRLNTTWTGNNIVDCNMANGESVVRNFLYGKKYLEENFNYTPKYCNRSDAFGNSAQLPQILRKFGMKMVFNITYSNANGNYWRGLDGSTVVVGTEPKSCGSTGGYYKYAPCPKCKGFKDGCDECGGRGIDAKQMEPFLVHINDEKIKEDGQEKLIRVWSEEILSSDESIKWYEKNKDKFDIHYVGYDDLMEKANAKLIANVDNAPENELHDSCEINVNNTGCYVSRIEAKRRLRKCENMMFSLETLLNASSCPDKEEMKKEIEKLWDNIIFGMFHDAVTGTHVDSANEELMEIYDETESKLSELTYKLLDYAKSNNKNVLSVYNPLSFSVTKLIKAEIKTDKNVKLSLNGKEIPVVSSEKQGDKTEIEFVCESIPAYETFVYDVEYTDCDTAAAVTTEEIKTNEAAEISDKIEERGATGASANESAEIFEIENNFYKITADTQGLIEIFDKKLNKPISKKAQFRPFELVMEHDEGSPWATLSEDMRRTGCSIWTRLLRIEKSSEFERLVFEVRPGDISTYSVMGFFGEYSVTLYKAIKHVDFRTSIKWDTYSYRIRIAVPSTIKGKHFYEIPFGYIERKPYEVNLKWPDNTSTWAGAAGDYPAINWAGITDGEASLALFNKGTPSYQISDDETGVNTIFVTPLRSPCIPTYLHDTQNYTMTDFDGMRDVGEYTFDFALCGYKGDFKANDAVKDGMIFNRDLLAVNDGISLSKLPTLKSENLVITNIKMSEDNKGIVLRVLEIHGADGKGELNIPFEHGGIFECDLNEKVIAELTNSIDAKPFEIKTVYIKL